VVVPRLGTALGTGLHYEFSCALERTRFFEASMPSLFHLGLSDRDVLCNPGILPLLWALGRPNVPHLRAPDTLYDAPMADEFDVDALVYRFQERAKAVRKRGMPPIEGPERKRFVDQARIDYMDYAMIGDASATLADGVLTLTIDLRPQPE